MQASGGMEDLCGILPNSFTYVVWCLVLIVINDTVADIVLLSV